MPTYLDYEKADENGQLHMFKLEKHHLTFFEKLEKELDVPLTIKYGDARSLPLRAAEDDDIDGLLIYDYATRRSTADIQNLDYIIVKKQNGTGATEMFLSKNPYHVRVGGQKAIDNQTIYTMSGGSALGSVSRKTIWLSVNLANFEKSEHLEFIKEAAVQALDNEYWDKIQEEQKAEVKKAFMSRVQTALKQELEAERHKLEASEKKLAELGEQLVTTHHAVSAAARKITFLQEQEANDTEFIDIQLRELYKNKHIMDVRFNAGNNTLDVYTKELYIYSPDRDERVPLGKMLMSFATNGAMRVTNLTNKRGGRPHPHVEQNGKPCWGQSQQSVSKLTAQGELVALFEVAIGYLEQYNPHDDYGRYGPYWFRDNEEIEFRTEEGEYVKLEDLPEKQKDQKKEEKDQKEEKIKGEEKTSDPEVPESIPESIPESALSSQ